MRILTRILSIGIIALSAKNSFSQSCISTGLNGSAINLPCNVNCAPFHFQVPHLKSTSDYRIVSIPYTPFAYSTAGGAELTALYADDVYGALISLPFSFCFYDSVYTKAVVGSNGIVTLDESQANRANAYPITAPIPYAGGTFNVISPAYYPPASIMGAYSDLDPRTTASPADRKIEWRVEGTAPCRRFIASYYHVGVFGNNTCGLATPNTFQMVLYESTGIIDFYFEKKACFPSTDGGNAILGLQNWQRDKAVAAPGKNATQWSLDSTAYRFVPSGPVSRFVKAELLDISGTVLATTGITAGADTATTTAGLLDLNFPQQCPAATSTQYIVKTYFASCSDPGTQMISSDTITVNKTTSLQATTSQVPSACGPNGSITVNIPPGAGTAPYTLTLDGGAPVSEATQTHTFAGLLGGPHTITVTTAGGCSQTLNITLASSGTLVVTSVVTPTSCVGAANGSFTINPSNGVNPFQYSLNGGAFQPGNSYSNLPPGTYFVTIKDNSGCILNNFQVLVPQGAPIVINAVANPPSCTGSANGSITVNPSTGTAPYQYSLNGGAFQPGNVFSNLPTGTYFISVKDAQSCTVTNQQVAVPAASGGLAATASATGTSCTGVNNGSINITPQAGSGPYTYSLNGGAFQPGTVITGLAPATYTVVVKDNSGCSSSPIQVTVSQGSALLATTASTQTSCTGVNNGSITVTPTNGSGPYTYALDGGTAQSNNIFTNVSAGNHNIIVTDGAGCVSNQISVTVAVGPALTGTTAPVATSCNGAGNGSVLITPTSGTGPYTYSLDGGSFQSSNTFSTLISGNHTAVIQDGAGCISSSIPFTVVVGPQLTATSATTPTSCSGALNGTITITNTNGTGPFQYSLDGVNFQASSTFSGLATGSYTVTYKNNIGCSSTVSATVNPGQPLSGTVSVNNVLCNSGNSGSSTVTLSNNGTAPYQYSLDGITWQASNIFNALTAGNYTVQFQDNNNCAGTQNFTVTEPTALTESVATQAVLCKGQSNGIITVTSSGGTNPYQYSLDGITYQSSNVFNVAAGSYTIYVKDNNNCLKTQTATITEPALLTGTTSTTNATCDGGTNGSLTANPSGGTSSYQYSLDGTNFQASNIFNLIPGNYTVTIKDANGCTTTKTDIVRLTNNLSVIPVVDTTICEGLSVKLYPNTNATQFAWSPATALTASNISQPTASPTTTTQYILTATLGICTASDSIIVNVLPAPIPDAGPDGDICYGQNYQLQGSGGASFQWTPSTYLSSTSISNPMVNPDQTTQYTLSVIDANGCHSLQTDVVSVNVTPPIVVQISRDTVVANGDVFQLHASSVATDYLWTPAAGLSSDTIPNPMVTVTGDITYTVTATTSAGCKGQASVTLKVYDGPEIYVPTAFTPNGDGKNDLFEPFPVGIKYYTYFRVFNRWGQMIFSTTEFNKGWDGKINGKDQPTGTYIWMVEGMTKNDKKIMKRGAVTLIR